jgi:hypothetical protein
MLTAIGVGDNGTDSFGPATLGLPAAALADELACLRNQMID